MAKDSYICRYCGYVLPKKEAKKSRGVRGIPKKVKKFFVRHSEVMHALGFSGDITTCGCARITKGL